MSSISVGVIVDLFFAVSSGKEAVEGGFSFFDIDLIVMAKVEWRVHFLEAVDESDGGVLSELWFNMFSDGSGSEEGEVLSLFFAEVVGADCS